ncbi:MAG: hypothetical protein CMJ12_00675 [Pelagibacterales bacterium]|nr:hypothetical protein [Pelagibacterales bacterium]PPR16198.1 MAG: hypothetical protein CFH33_00862 [Alphaproteobacteria bacterium MarineAlpha9_Bin3]|tara:strand:+ start:549 stop:734 length:186 start_codon:yes stop_codon:yes gene_type:complete
MKHNDQNNLPFIHKDTKKIVKKGKVLLIIEKNKYLIEYNNKKYICIINEDKEVFSCYSLWS